MKVTILEILHDSQSSDQQCMNGKVRGQLKIVSFSVWGAIQGGREYLKGVEKNLELMRTVYPGWVMRLYISRHKMENLDKAINLLCELQCSNSNIEM